MNELNISSTRTDFGYVEMFWFICQLLIKLLNSLSMAHWNFLFNLFQHSLSLNLFKASFCTCHLSYFFNFFNLLLQNNLIYFCILFYTLDLVSVVVRRWSWPWSFPPFVFFLLRFVTLFMFWMIVSMPSMMFGSFVSSFIGFIMFGFFFIGIIRSRIWPMSMFSFLFIFFVFLLLVNRLGWSTLLRG